GVGEASIFVQVQGNRSTSLDFYVHGLAASGNVFYTAAAAGFGSNTGTVTLNPSGVVIQGPFGFGNPLLTTSGAPPTNVTVMTAMLDGGGNFVEIQALAGGANPVQIDVSSSNTA